MRHATVKVAGNLSEVPEKSESQQQLNLELFGKFVFICLFIILFVNSRSQQKMISFFLVIAMIIREVIASNLKLRARLFPAVYDTQDLRLRSL